MAQSFIYEQHYRPTGWFDDGGLSKAAWWDPDIVDPVIVLYYLLPALYAPPDVFFEPEPVSIVTFPAIFVDPDVFYRPASVRSLNQPDQMLKNEVRRIR